MHFNRIQMNVTFTTGLDGTDTPGSCVSCTYFVSDRDEYRTHLDPWEYGSCYHPEVLDKNLRFGLYMTCSLRNPRVVRT